MEKDSLILLQGALSNKSQFDSILFKLKAFYDVHAINFSGHGNDEFMDEFTLSLFMNDVEKYMLSTNIKSAYFFGYSMGGYIAIYLAALRPKLVKSVITLGTKLDWSIAEAEKEVKKLNVELMEQKIPEYVNMLQTFYFPNDWKQVVRKTISFMNSLGQDPINDIIIEKIECKVKILLGEMDKMVPLETVIPFANRLKYGSFFLLPDTPHPFDKVDELKLLDEMVKYFID